MTIRDAVGCTWLIVCVACAGPAASPQAVAVDTSSGTTNGADTAVHIPPSGLADGTAVAMAPDTAADVPISKPDAPPAPGTFGAPCQANGDCASGYCVPGPAGKLCTQGCVDVCPEGFACTALTGTADVTYVCVARWLHLCDPCEADAACADLASGGGARCLSYGDDGSFCGTPCQQEADCPKGFACVAEGGTGGQCRNVSGLCTCSAAAVGAKLATSCHHSSAFGTCDGVRGCSEAGLSACTAPIPKAEACNDQDDDCDGATDEDIAPAPCVNSNGHGVCAGQTACEKGKVACLGAVPAKETCNGQDDDCDGAIDESACDDGNSCTEDACNISLGGCLFAQVTKPCNDGDVCTTDDTCKAGKCLGDPVSCDDGDACTLDSCGAATGCTHAAAPGASCDDGKPCTAGDTCAASGCAGTLLADGATCTDGNKCTLAAECQSGTCTVMETSCSDGNPCTDDACDSGAGGACKHF